MLIITKYDKSSHGSVTLLLENTLRAKSQESGHYNEQLIHQGAGYSIV